MERDYWRLRHMETRYRLLFQVASEAVLILDAATRQARGGQPGGARAVRRRARARPAGRSPTASTTRERRPRAGDCWRRVRATGRADERAARLGGRPAASCASRRRCSARRRRAHLLVRVSPRRRRRRRRASAPAQSALLQADRERARRLRRHRPRRPHPDRQPRLPRPGAARHRGAGARRVARALARPHRRRPERADRQPAPARLGAPVRHHAARRVRRARPRSRSPASRSPTASSPASASRSATSAAACGARRAHGARELPRSVEQLTELVGRVPLKDIVRETTDLIEQLCIEAALELTARQPRLGRRDARPVAPEPLRQAAPLRPRRSDAGPTTRVATESLPTRLRLRAGVNLRLTYSSVKRSITRMARPALSRRRRAAEADHLVSADVGLRLRRRRLGRRRSTGAGRSIVVGVLLAGPLVCATSQAVNDWFDRHVDAINEPQRPIPSGRMPGRWGLYIAIALDRCCRCWSPRCLGPWGFGAAVVGLLLAWAYSAPPLRLKRNGWWGNAACGLCYEGLPWFTGAAVMAGGAMPDARSLALAAALQPRRARHHDAERLQVDRGRPPDGRRARCRCSSASQRAARVACWVMAVPQVVVVAAAGRWGAPVHARGDRRCCSRCSSC